MSDDIKYTLLVRNDDNSIQFTFRELPKSFVRVLKNSNNKNLLTISDFAIPQSVELALSVLSKLRELSSGIEVDMKVTFLDIVSKVEGLNDKNKAEVVDKFIQNAVTADGLNNNYKIKNSFIEFKSSKFNTVIETELL